MKKLIFSLSVFMLAACIQLQAQNLKLDAIVKTYLDNIGGADNWKKLKTMKMSGTVSAQNMEFPITIYSKPEQKQRIEASVQGQQIIQGFDGTNAWWINPFTGNTEPQPMPEAMAKQMKEQTFQDAFIDYKKKGHQAELVGVETIEGKQAYNVKFTLKTGEVKNYYFDTTTLLPFLVRSVIAEGPAAGQNADAYFGDFQKVDGLLVPGYYEVRNNNQVIQKITLESFTFNEEMDDSMFAMPGK